MGLEPMMPAWQAGVLPTKLITQKKLTVYAHKSKTIKKKQ